MLLLHTMMIIKLDKKVEGRHELHVVTVVDSSAFDRRCDHGKPQRARSSIRTEVEKGKRSQNIIEHNIQQKESYAAPCLSFDRSIAISHVSHLRMS